MNDGPWYVATDVLPSRFGAPMATSAGRMSSRLTPFCSCVAVWPSKVFLKYVGKAWCT